MMMKKAQTIHVTKLNMCYNIFIICITLYTNNTKYNYSENRDFTRTFYATEESIKLSVL